MTDGPIHTSKSTARSLWQEYRVYPDHLEFDTILGCMTIPFAHIERFEILDSDVSALCRGDLRLENFRPAVKLDWANFVEHIVLDKNSGHVRRVLFTPDDPAAFEHALEEALARFREDTTTAGA